MVSTVIRQLGQNVNNSNFPTVITNSAAAAIYAAGPLAWWTNNQATMKGVVDANPFAWVDQMTLAQLATAIAGGNPPIATTDPSSGIEYLAMGYGGSLAQRNFLPVQASVVAVGSGYAAGDTLTDAQGTVYTISSTGQLGITTPGAYSSYPSNPVSQVSTSGSGTGKTWDLDFEAINGSLVAPSGGPLLPVSGPLSFVSVFRCPVVGGVAGATPGGILIGNALNQSQTLSGTVNVRFCGLGIGGGTGANIGDIIWRVVGDNLICFPSSALDLRDGNWHVAIGGMTPSGAIAKLWLDGVSVASLTIPTSTAVNGTTGGRNIRVGAAGLLGSPPVFGWAGDLGDQMAWGIDLTATANASIRQTLDTYLMTKYGITGTST